MPKPMINIVGRPMILWLLDNLKFQPEDTLWIGIQRSLSADFAVEARLRREYQSLDLRLVFLDFQTRGAAETLFIMLQVKLAKTNNTRSLFAMSIVSQQMHCFREVDLEVGT